MGPKVNSRAKSECGAGPSNLPKRRKMESLITAVQENNIEQVIMLVKDPELVKTTNNFSFKGFELSKVPPLVIAVLLDNNKIISCLAEKEPHFNRKEDPTNKDNYIFDIKRPLKKEDRPQVIENLEIVGAVLILHSNYQHGVSCLSEAKKLRERSDYCCTDEPASKKTFLECLAFAERSREFHLKNFTDNSIEELFYWKSRAFIIAEQFLSKYGAFPNLFVVHLLIDFALKNWKSRELSPNLALVVSIYLLKLYDSSTFENIIKEKPKDSFKLILSTFEELILVVNDNTFNYKLNTILNNDLLMLCLDLCCQLQVKARQNWAYDEASTKEDLTTKISDSILGILQMLIFFSRYEIKEEEVRLFERASAYCKYIQTREILTLDQCFSKHLFLHELNMTLYDGKKDQPKLNVTIRFRQNGFKILRHLKTNPASRDLNPLYFSNFEAFKKLMNTEIQFSFDQLINCVNLCSDVLLKVYKSLSDPICDLLLDIIKRLMPFLNSMERRLQVKICLRTHILRYESLNLAGNPSLLVKACTRKMFSFQKMNQSDFELIKMLLQLGSNPNAFDGQYRTPLHLLSKNECGFRKEWSLPTYTIHAQTFTETVQEFLIDGRVHEDSKDSHGLTAFDCFQEVDIYPNPEFVLIKDCFMQRVSSTSCVRPLSCLAAQVIKQYRLSCQELPVILRPFVLQH